MSRASFDYDVSPKNQVPCPGCDGRAFETLCVTDRYLMGVTTSRCTGCGLVMTNPMPTPAALEDFYAHHYRQYYRKLDRPDLSYIRRYALDRRARGTVGYLRRHGLLGPGKRVMDVGCGEGSLLREARASCPEAEAIGVEVYAPFAEFAAGYGGCPVYRSLDAVPARELFDLVVISHVLEHVPDPVGFLRSLRERLRPGGRVFIDVPDVRAYHWLPDLHIAHVYHFSPRTLAAVAERAGLGAVAFEPHRSPKLPRCIRGVFHVGPHQVEMPEDLAAEAAAADRIRRMTRGALLVSLTFRVVMFTYETIWSIRTLFAGRKADRPTPVPQPASGTA